MRFLFETTELASNLILNKLKLHNFFHWIIPLIDIMLGYRNTLN